MHWKILNFEKKCWQLHQHSFLLPVEIWPEWNRKHILIFCIASFIFIFHLSENCLCTTSIFCSVLLDWYYIVCTFNIFLWNLLEEFYACTTMKGKKITFIMSRTLVMEKGLLLSIYGSTSLSEMNSQGALQWISIDKHYYFKYNIS